MGDVHPATGDDLSLIEPSLKLKSKVLENGRLGAGEEPGEKFEQRMHLYNAWLPPPVVEQVAEERQRFSALVAQVDREWQPDDPASLLETVQTIPIINTFPVIRFLLSTYKELRVLEDQDIIYCGASWDPFALIQELLRVSSLKLFFTIERFMKAKSDLAISDLEALVSTAFELIRSTDNLFVQQRWGHCLSKILRKYRHKLNVTIEWRPLYVLLMNVHFERRHSYEGYDSKRSHLNTMISLVRKSRCFFPSGSAAEIWMEFRPALDDISHNSALEAMGFLSLLLPSPLKRTEEVAAFYTSAWVTECLGLWDALPHSNYWSLQWASLLGRCIKYAANMSFDWEPFLRTLYMQYLRTFEVPVGKSGAWPPVYRRIPREVYNAFFSRSAHIATIVARSIVYLLSPASSAQTHLESLIDLLEQYYHPSNGGSWTTSLERFLRFLVGYFMKRTAHEQLMRAELGGTAEQAHFLGPAERVAFVKVVMRLIERGQYSKTVSLVASAVTAASKLSHLEPLIVLPHIVSCFQSAMDTITATHQLQSSLTGLALAARTLLLASEIARKTNSEMSSLKMDSGFDLSGSELQVSLLDCRNTLVDAMFNTLPGLDANDPPKTLATLQLYCSVLSSVTIVGNPPAGQSETFPIDWSLWVDMFLSRLFVLLLNLEPPSFEPEADNGFLMDTGSHYPSLLLLLLGRATPSLYHQALRMVTKFVRTNILPGAVDEIGMLCSAAVYVSPSLALQQLVKPIMSSIISSLVESPSTGFSSSASRKSSQDFKDGLSPALETTVSYQLKVLSKSVILGGAFLPPHKGLLKEVIAAAFDAPSSKVNFTAFTTDSSTVNALLLCLGQVNEAGSTLLRFVTWSVSHYYPLEYTKSYSNGEDDLEKWFSAKGRNTPKEGSSPTWHLPNDEEKIFVEELLQLHLQDSLADLRIIGGDAAPTKSSGQERERLRVLLLRLDGSLQGVGSCLPDFVMPAGMGLTSKKGRFDIFTIAGSTGPSIGSAALRGEIADTLHSICEYMLKDRADDTILLKILVRLLDFTGNYGTGDYNDWVQDRAYWDADAKTLTEPCANLITNPDPEHRRRPLWLLIQRASLHNEYRASQATYYHYCRGQDAPSRVHVLLKDLLKLSLHSYYAVRLSAGRRVEKLLDRYPALIKECIPLLTASLQDSTAKEETVLGSCHMLMFKPVMRYLMQDWNALSSFFLSLLSSSHHETIKAQNAINELFLVFNFLYGGVPFSSYASLGANLNEMSYSTMITHIHGQVVPGRSASVHWRYNLMANGILLFLVLPPPYDPHSSYAGTVTKSRENMAGGFIANLQSELPALRPLSVIALLFLLQATSPVRSGPKMLRSSSWLEQQTDHKDYSVISMKSTLVSIMQSQGFGHKVIGNLAVDHHYFEGQNSYNPQRMSDVGLTALMPIYMREWPRTRTWDNSLEGEAFSPTFARLFQYLVQECGSIAVETLRGPLEEACNEVGERGKQCVAAEIMAGLLHSDNGAVVESWDDLFGPLLRKALLNSTMESATEWGACVRFAVGGEGRLGRVVPTLRYKILDCLGEPLPDKASTSLLTKRLTLLRAALNELLPISILDKDTRFQKGLLKEVVTYMSHQAPQVRQGVGRMMCILCSNLQRAADVYSEPASQDVSAADGINDTNKESEIDWRTVLVEGAEAAATKIRTEGNHHLGDACTSIESYSPESKEAVRWMETVLHFIMAAVTSGNGPILMKVLVELLHPLLSLQETWNKELAKKAKTAMILMWWQPFGSDHLGAAVSTVVTCARDSNWHTRVAALKFMQPLIYRHTYILANTDLEALWECVHQLLSDSQLEVRELASTTLAGMMKGEGGKHAQVFRENILESAKPQLLAISKKRKSAASGLSIVSMHGLVLGLSACVLSVPYDMPSWLPFMVVSLARFIREPWPVRATVTKTIGEFRRTHMDTWDLQKTSFSEDQLEILSDLTSSASYFA